MFARNSCTSPASPSTSGCRLPQLPGDLDGAALAVAEREDLAPARARLDGALGQHHQQLPRLVAQLRVGREARARVRRLDRVEQAPEDLALALQRRRAALLVLGRARVLQHEAQALGGVARRLLRAAAEVAQAGGVDPRVVLLEGGDAGLHDVAGEELGERRGDALEQVVGLDEAPRSRRRRAHAGQHVREALDLAALEADGLGQREPELEPAAALLVAVVVVDALHPAAPEARVRGLREDQPVLDRDARLVVVAVAHPGLDLLPGQRARVHAQVERMAVVVALLADPRSRASNGTRAHASISSPSAAISTPARRTRAASGEAGSSTGLVPFRWK